MKPDGFSQYSGIYIPEICVPEYKSEKLRDCGLGAAISFSVLFGDKLSVNEILDLLRKYNSDNLFRFICTFSNYISINGTREVAEDVSQREFLQEGIKKGVSLGYKVEYPDDIKVEKSNLANPYLIHLLLILAITLSEENCGSIDIHEDIGYLALAALGLSDYSIPYSENADPKSIDLHYNTIRNGWLQTPFLGTTYTLLERLHRFVNLTSMTLDKMRKGYPRETKRLMQCFKEEVGLDFEEFNDVIFAINSIWLGHKDVQTPILNINPIDKPIHSTLYKYVSRISKNLSDYRLAIKEISPDLDISTIGIPGLIRLLTKYPFVELENYNYLLLGPHLLLRQIELSLYSSFIENKISKSAAVYKGPLGDSAESYVQRLAKTCVKKNRNCGTEFYHIPRDDEGLCDFVISHSAISIVFEVKYSEPNFMKAFEDSEDGLNEFKDWFHKTFLLEPSKRSKTKKTPGAIYQLNSAAKKLIDEGCPLGIKPRMVLPVIVCAQSLIFELPFFEIVDKEIKSRDLFGNRILPFLVMGVQDFEHLYSIDNLNEQNMTFRELLVEKSSRRGARSTAWPIFIERLGLNSGVPKEFMDTADMLLKRSQQLFRDN